MATSLINDSGYVINISRKLAEASQVVLRDRTYDLVMSARAGDVGDADSGVASRGQCRRRRGAGPIGGITESVRVSGGNRDLNVNP